MNTKVINTEDYRLEIRPDWNDEIGNFINISISLSEKELLQFTISSKKTLMRMLMILANPTAGGLNELEKISKEAQLELWSNSKNLADEKVQAGISEGLRFLEKFKSIDIWSHLRQIGYQELLPQE